MTILWRERSLDIFNEHSAEALVNPVNCVGVSGAGLAREFKTRFPYAQLDYQYGCADGRVRIGHALFSPTYDDKRQPKGPLRYIVHLPTKKHWRDKSVLKDVELGLVSLIHQARQFKVQTVAIPALGCGNGGLLWPDVRELLESKLEPLQTLKAIVFVPHEVPPYGEEPA